MSRTEDLSDSFCVCSASYAPFITPISRILTCVSYVIPLYMNRRRELARPDWSKIVTQPNLKSSYGVLHSTV